MDNFHGASAALVFSANSGQARIRAHMKNKEREKCDFFIENAF